MSGRDLKVGDAQALCRATRGRGTIVLVFFGNRLVHGASYGETKRECADLGKVLDRIADDVQTGVMEVWGPAAGERRWDKYKAWSAGWDAALEALTSEAFLLAQPAGSLGFSALDDCIRALRARPGDAP